MESPPGELAPPAELVRSARAPSARARLGVGAAIVLFLIALVAAVLVSAFGSAGTEETISVGGPGPGTSSNPGASPQPGASGGGEVAEAPLYVHVWGAVADAGLYRVAAGSRVVDVIAAAGGFADDADPAGVNLARALSDGEQLHVPRLGEAPPPVAAQPGGAAGAGSGVLPLINLNTATQAELETLPRIGPALAQRILDWREANGGFGAVDDLRSVTGIGAKTFDGLKDLVTV
ncbi:ComEA family DNA-binding protein [Microterricola viridarii]|uniref:Helix-hairpin-helix DNA-binding motif class 1 domain-containing protein n=1 Tax=Microterricola viridarii TaxID=412690 RepID=A0A109QWS9_9MICO|nr:ComEA family DNA-binding protein [Microterricola viridarii]AMB58682.1 hypothetical protein AWU67_07190 [Microterricola viridarii]